MLRCLALLKFLLKIDAITAAVYRTEVFTVRLDLVHAISGQITGSSNMYHLGYAFNFRQPSNLLLQNL